MGNARVYLTPDISAHSTTVRAGQLAELAPHRSGSLPLPAPNMLRLDESLPKSIWTPACFTYAQRFHQGIGSQSIMPKTISSNDNAMLGLIGCRSRLGGLLNFYHRKAA